ncbi:hypothetical protein COO60DRAFT_551744 [Scenedesmus sp. NREL 46B-D3]|nr:hypothetical protein COO60DRAFT_551744 [Scenedesmus sp. NREL 46B-D3]
MALLLPSRAFSSACAAACDGHVAIWCCLGLLLLAPAGVAWACCCLSMLVLHAGPAAAALLQCCCSSGGALFDQLAQAEDVAHVHPVSLQAFLSCVLCTPCGVLPCIDDVCSLHAVMQVCTCSQASLLSSSRGALTWHCCAHTACLCLTVEVNSCLRLQWMCSGASHAMKDGNGSTTVLHVFGGHV